MVTIDQGKMNVWSDPLVVPKEKWLKLMRFRRDFMAIELSHDCRCLLRFVRETEMMFKELGFKSTKDMILNGYELDPENVNTAIEWLKRNDPEYPIPIQATLGKHGGDRKSKEVKDQDYIVILKRQGNDKEYTKARLARDRPDLLVKVEAGELSANKAAIEAGWRKRTMQVPADDLQAALAKINSHYGTEYK